MKWFRWYRGSTENPKFVLIAQLASNPSDSDCGDRVSGAVSLTDVIAVWCVILEDASNDSHWGICTKDATFISIVLRWHSEEIQSILDSMVDQNLLSLAPNGGYKVEKWEEYQYASDKDPTNAERQRRYYNKHKTQTKQQPNALAKRPETETETETDNKKEATPPKKVSQSTGSRLPPDWELEQEEGDWAVQRGLSPSEVLAEAEKFKDFWKAKAGKDAVKLDWTATWRNWIRRKIEDGKYGKIQGNAR